MALDIAVDVDSPVPPYEQIRRQIAAFVQGGLLVPGARLPTMRALAADLGVAVGTVARAYTELEAAGMVTSRRPTGTVVTGPPAARARAGGEGARPPPRGDGVPRPARRPPLPGGGGAGRRRTRALRRRGR